MSTSPASAPPSAAVTAGAVVAAWAVTRRYGEQDSAVDALRGVSMRVPTRRVHRRDGAVRLRQVDPDAHPRRARRAHHRAGLDRRRGDHRHERRRAHAAASAPHRLHLPVLQPAPDAHGGAERGSAAVDRGREAREGVGRRGDPPGRTRRAAHPQAVRAVRRPAAARRDRAGTRLAPDDSVRRRADREPRLDHQRRDPRADARVRGQPRSDNADGDPRRERGGDRRPRPVPRGRVDRRGRPGLSASTRCSRRWRD